MNASDSDPQPRSCCHAPAKKGVPPEAMPASNAPHGHGHSHAHGAGAHGGDTPSANEAVYMGLPHERYLRPRFWVALVLSTPVLILAMGSMLAPAQAAERAVVEQAP